MLNLIKANSQATHVTIPLNIVNQVTIPQEQQHLKKEPDHLVNKQHQKLSKNNKQELL